MTGVFATLMPLAAGAAQAVDGMPDIAHGRRVFQTCSSCHAIDTTANRFGPSLKGVFGRPAATVTDYAYSPAMRNAATAGLVWDDTALSDFLANPKRKIPGTSMRFWGLWTQSEIDDVIGYLKANP